jgi:hypothetical protein
LSLTSQENIISYPTNRETAGHSSWIVLHNAAAAYPRNPTQKDADDFKHLLLLTIKALPCDTCKDQAKSYIKENPPALGSRDSLVTWLCDFHNDNNKKLGKTELACNTLLGLKSELSCPSCSSSLPGPAEPETEMTEAKGSSSDTNKDRPITESPVHEQASKTTLKDVHSSLKDFKEVSKKIIEELCKRDKLPVPEIVFAPCPERPNTSCTSILRDPFTRQTYKKQIYLNPNVFALRTLAHEYYHYKLTVSGDDELAADETAVEVMAQDILNKEFEFDKIPSAVTPLREQGQEKITQVQVQTMADAIVEPSHRRSFLEKYRERKERRKSGMRKVHERMRGKSAAAETGTAARPNAATGGGENTLPVSTATIASEEKFPMYNAMHKRFEIERFAESKDGDDKDGFFSGFDKLYDPISSHVGIPSRTLNEAFTANFIASTVETIAKSNLSPIGSLIFSGVGGLTLLASNLFLKGQAHGVALGDRKMLTAISANLLTGTLNYANPKVSKKILSDAKKIGGHLAAMEFDQIVPMLIESPFLKGMQSKKERRRMERGDGDRDIGRGQGRGGGRGDGDDFSPDTTGGYAHGGPGGFPGGPGESGGGSIFSPTQRQGEERMQGQSDSSGVIASIDNDPNLTFHQRLRLRERALGVGMEEQPGDFAQFKFNIPSHAYPSPGSPPPVTSPSDFGFSGPPMPPGVQRQPITRGPSASAPFGDILEDDEVLNPQFGYLNPEEEELFGGAARADDIYGVRRNSLSWPYDDWSDMR